MIRVVLPTHLRQLARVSGSVAIEVKGAVTRNSILDSLEDHYPMLSGTIRDQTTLKRRPFIRFFVCGEDWTHEAPDKPLPTSVAEGVDHFSIVGAMAGG